MAGVTRALDGREAFYKYVDKLYFKVNWIRLPAMESLQDLENYPEFTKRFRNSSEPQDNSPIFPVILFAWLGSSFEL